MRKQAPLLVTVDEAVARILNVDYVPEGFSLLEMTAAFLEDAEIDCENARIDRLPDDQKSFLAIRANVCEARHQLAQQLLSGLELELESAESDIVRIASDDDTVPRLNMESVSDWAFYEFGIGTPTGLDFGRKKEQTAVALNWDDVTIKLSADNKLGFKVRHGKYRNYSFKDIGLMGKRRDKPNYLALILMRLSLGIKVPNGKFAQGPEKKSMSILRGCLLRLTGLTGDPFWGFNEADGWKPRFKLIEDQGLSDPLTGKEGMHESYDDARGYSSAESYDPHAPDEDD